ncbi:hypothetical protein SELR_17990 [Selenomonas ruminantium subsp. lactilytica TAM6421]|uniref:Uncharacterized protein n=1 Tax=Selenomonas ruminantium subsp. lactilytica (strain NBRC 103574 / TAM6421) TaxID=927704 RepID=I0GRX0_SELRL|nr:hypothetical protein [Selenomonas ruminantium]BAL83507.1 hypothetical protein SELR_17990 [Selenomonas ruminantium subsp. lactilytica TAM6421]
MSKREEVAFEVLCDINACAYWLSSLDVCDDKGNKVSHEVYEELRTKAKRRVKSLCREDVWLEGMKNGYCLKAEPDDDEPVIVTYDRLLKACNGYDIDDSYFDGCAVDRIFQTACFGKVVYG